MKLKRLLILEITIAIVLLISLFAFIEIRSYLGISQSINIGLYNEREYAEGNAKALPGETTKVQFPYLSYEPAILIIELSFHSVEKPGYLTVLCNYKLLESMFVNQENSSVRLYAMSVSGAGWVETLSSMTGLNEVHFDSGLENGFEGTINYKIKLRGTR